MEDLLMISFKAQVKYIENRIHDEDKKLDFIRGKCYFLDGRRSFDVVQLYGHTEGFRMAIDIWNETEKNLKARFETGVPLETSYYDYC